jgi:hypothetical protein
MIIRKGGKWYFFTFPKLRILSTSSGNVSLLLANVVFEGTTFASKRETFPELVLNILNLGKVKKYHFPPFLMIIWCPPQFQMNFSRPPPFPIFLHYTKRHDIIRFKVICHWISIIWMTGPGPASEKGGSKNERGHKRFTAFSIFQEHYN